MSAIAIEASCENSSLAALVFAAQDGDREAFGELAARYERTVYAVALRRLGNHAEAQELTQEVFIQALRKIGQLREPASFGGWLRSITVRLAINRSVRANHAASVEPSMLESTCVEHQTPLGSALARERQEMVRSVLGRLGRLDRETLEAFYVNGQSLVEMSDRFDSPLGTIKRRLHVARKRFVKAMDAQQHELVAV